MTEKSQDDYDSSDISNLEAEFRSDGGVEVLDHYDTFMSSQQALIQVTDEAMRGEGLSMDSNCNHLNLMLIASANSYAALVQSADDVEERAALATKLFKDSHKDLEGCIERSSVDIEISFNYENLGEVIEHLMSIEDVQTQAKELRELFSNTNQQSIIHLLNSAPKNENDVIAERREYLKDLSIRTAFEIGKVALGAVAAVAAVRLFDKFNKR